MPREVALCPGALPLVLLLAAFAAPQIVIDQDQRAAKRDRCCWPPKVAELVSRDAAIRLEEKKTFALIYKVPPDKWFVLTDLHVELSKGFNAQPSLVQRKDGKDVVRLGWQFLYRYTGHPTAPLGNPTTGLAFPPKSLLILVPRLKEMSSHYAYHLRGYLTDR